MNAAQRRELVNEVRRVLRRANRQRGRVPIEISLATEEGQPGNAGTLFEVQWEVRGERLWLRLMIDGIMWAEVSG